MTINPDFAIGDRVQIQSPEAAFVAAQPMGTVLRLPEDRVPFYTVQFDDRAIPLLFCGDELMRVFESVS